MQAGKRLDEQPLGQRITIEPLSGRAGEAEFTSHSLVKMAQIVKHYSPECNGCAHAKIDAMQAWDHRTAEKSIQLKARCDARTCIHQESNVTSNLSDIFKPGWTTSKPGDMKNPGGLPTRFGKDIVPIPRTEFDLDIKQPKWDIDKDALEKMQLEFINGHRRAMAAETFRREYQGTFNGDASNAVFKPEPVPDRDTPEGSLLNAW